ncbi:MAG: 2-amino-4-hydroxy-6-hydroxymethyldihydropteridine diphosphokinase [Dehalococcoidia bacterium]|nr:2-amino-4-hydroxy-6-hydroxymethyldihydropteridine diphosphokinase [Dehalococcoidia bacterium]
MNEVYLSLGSNLGDRESNLDKALQLLAQSVAVQKTSSIYETEPLDYPDQPSFLNMVCFGTTGNDPLELLSLAKEIENQIGRISSFPSGPRVIDIDILFYNDQVIETENLIIPHPRIGERAFVLVPLAEIAPELVHPVNGKSIKKLLAEIAGLQQVRRWPDVSNIGKAAL